MADRFVLGGLCSGAYWSLRRALVDERVRGLLLLNLYAFEYSRERVASEDGGWRSPRGAGARVGTRSTASS